MGISVLAIGLMHIAGVCNPIKMVPGEKKYFALLLIAVMALFLSYAALSLLAGIFGAAVLYAIFRPPYLWLEQKTKMKALSAFIIMVISVPLIPLPISYPLFVAIDGEDVQGGIHPRVVSLAE